ncbi:MAG TPA: siroheme synthase CysG [Novimethylophilus sp.]|jgi:uroporphyrin-III C-methyltransferase/precorrin-2 dehydrogenase/sirohydrochlorin ferrochelatase|uniref:siroheme synthase CysG n=1 Tax=Novimethylophilus sp. TaxID=2137426 RepID=UPI002F412004
MDHLPIFITLRGRCCVVVGGGEIAARKIGLLCKAHAMVTIVAPELCPALAEHRQQGLVDWIAARFEPHHLDGATLAIAATDDEAVNRAVSAAAQTRNIPVNIVDQPALCTFVFPSIIDRSPIVVAVSSGGAAPVLSRMLRSRLETMIPAAYGRLAELAGAFREQVKQRLGSMQQRRIFWENIFEGPIAEQMLAGREDAAKRALQRALDNAADAGARGEVYLVGGGPGDPDLLTFRALRLMQKADVVVYDALVSEGVMDLVRRDAERIYVGKQRANHALPQEDINALLVRLALDGRRVLRLKGGDPFIFGRGGEEIETLAEHGIPFQVVPGISAANGVASYAGIPLTHRDYAQSVLFATGHLRDNSIDLDWEALARPRQTVVIYMGLTGLAIICRKLIEQGLPRDWPAAVIQQGTTRHQRVMTGTLENLAQKVEAAGFKAPTLTIVGEVVKLRDKLAWFDPQDGDQPPLLL